ncbi:MAG: phosphotransferase [Verrucomicrobiota bacterium]|nr:phosphotransferase [Verrucomicrobiota bacterium]
MISVVDERRALLADWLEKKTSLRGGVLSIASADASFRRYFRLLQGGKSYIVMDAPPELEPSLAFVEIGTWMKQAGILVPEIFAQDLELGFLVLSDFGDYHFQDALGDKSWNSLYQLATDELVNFQNSLGSAEKKLPTFSKSWQWKELDIFREWCLPDVSKKEFQETFSALVESIDQIPKAFMHRDFHCRNLLICSSNELGIIDFQGAMFGPVTYDLVSLLRDCYVENQEDWISHKVASFQQKLISAGLAFAKVETEEFMHWFDLTGLQRHLKCIGIFNRLKIRDNKPDYMNDVPRVQAYVETVLYRYPELESAKTLFQKANIQI